MHYSYAQCDREDTQMRACLRVVRNGASDAVIVYLRANKTDASRRYQSLHENHGHATGNSGFVAGTASSYSGL